MELNYILTLTYIYDGALGIMMLPHRKSPHPNLWNLWLCYISYSDVIKVTDIEIGRLFQFIQVNVK